MRSGGIYGFGGIRDRFDSIAPPVLIANTVLGLIGLWHIQQYQIKKKTDLSLGMNINFDPIKMI